MAGKDGATWRHNWVPTNAAAARLKTHGRSDSFHAVPAAALRNKTARPATTKPPLPAGSRPVPLAKVGKLRSGNDPRMTVEQEFQKKVVQGQYSANDIARAARYGQTPRQYQAEITEHIRQHGVINAAQVSDGVLDEGFHRYAALRQLRRRTVPVKRSN